MSVAAALAFMQQVAASKELQAEIGALKGASALQDLAKIAHVHGHDFTAEEYRQAVVMESGGELSEEAIDSLASEMGLQGGAPGAT